jgi:predicted dehydrogenase
MFRRTFLKNTSLATAGITLLNFPIFGRNAPSNKVIVAVMGVNSRGAYLAKCYSQLQNVEVAYICDVEEKAIQNGLNALKETNRKPTVFKDIRKLLEQKDMDALIIAAPDHWHAPGALMAVAAGKHVYVEKPCGQNPYEGELLGEALQKFGKLIQMGNQRRSMPTMMEAAKQVRGGVIGNAYLGKAWYANNRKSIGFG